MSSLEKEKSKLEKSQKDKHQKETAELKDQIKQLQTQLAESQSNSPAKTTSISAHSGDNKVVDKLKEDNEVAQGQVSRSRSLLGICCC